MSRAKLHNPGRPISLVLGTLEIEAFSISGLASYVAIPALDACFDLGHCSNETSHLRNVLLSHVHQDHSLGVVRHLSLRQMTGQKPSRIYVPIESRQAMIDMLRAYERLEEKEPADLESIVRGLAPDETFALSPKRTVRAFDVRHRIASLGYSVFETRRKLKPAYQGMAGEDIRDAHLRGEALYDFHDVNVMTYVGDSTLETLELHPEIGGSEVLFLEATHLPGTPADVSAKYGHTHLDQLADLYRRHPTTLASPYIVLKHFSLKYDVSQIRAARESLPEGLRERVTLLIPS